MTKTVGNLGEGCLNTGHLVFVCRSSYAYTYLVIFSSEWMLEKFIITEEYWTEMVS